MQHKYFYLIEVQYLGFRFHGWQKQPNLKTVHFMIDKTLKFVLGHTDFRTVGSSRTDAKVSANSGAFELFLQEPILNKKSFLELFNQNLPSDIKVLNVSEVDSKFNIIQTPRIKEYLYLFSFGEKAHPFSAALVASTMDMLDIELMKEGAKLFEGQHNFVNYCAKPTAETKVERKVLYSRIQENVQYQANFFPTKTYAYHVHGKGFLRYQVRLMMGQLFRLGKHEITLDEIKHSLTGEELNQVITVAPSSGLILNNTSFKLDED